MNSSNVVQIRRWVATAVIAAALIAGGVLAIGLRNWSGREVLGASKFPVTMAKDTSPVSLGTLQNGFAAILKPVLPAVVNISSSKVVKPHNQMMPGMPFDNPFFQQFFGGPDDQQQAQPRSERETSLGSGVIITSDGTILTNNHVIDGASEIKVTLNGPNVREYTAKVVGADKDSDVAVLKIDATGLPTLPFGNASNMQVGDVVLAIGDPFGIGETATMGIVSATGRRIGIEGPNGYENFIQTDAAINPGNSGGAMIDLHGNLVGINTAIATGGGSEGSEGVGFAIPIQMAQHVMDQIEAHGKVIRGYIGVRIAPVTPDAAKAFGLDSARGALVEDVEPGTPGAKAGLRHGDIVMSVDGKPVTDASQLSLMISDMAPGTNVKLQVWRDGKQQEIDVALAELPSQTADNASGETSGATLQGVRVQNLTPDISQQLQLPSDVHGVIVSSVDDSSQAAEAGLQRGMIIQEVNRKRVSNAAEFKQAIASAGNQPVLLWVYMPQQQESAYIVVQSH